MPGVLLREASHRTVSIPELILAKIKQFDVDVIEVVGHTDEQPLVLRQSNLDRDLVPVLTAYCELRA